MLKPPLPLLKSFGRLTAGILRRRLAVLSSYLRGGGAWRERILLQLLDRHYRERFRRQWCLVTDPAELPHFTDHRIAMFAFAFGNKRFSHQFFNRAVFSAEVLRPTDKVLDIGCGDGYLTQRFLAEHGAHVDAIDIEPSSIRIARQYHAAPNIAYHRLDAVRDPFPGKEYDVVVWDGAIGHFAPRDTETVLHKIRDVLLPEGVFVGSESLGNEGQDHLQFFHSPADLARMFHPFFAKVVLREAEFTFCYEAPLRRKEAYWRCAQNDERLRSCRWMQFPAAAPPYAI
jgi:2-polyprenyl-3-methyl-5-hydroxy-6-metoxy-1,4-benzoquinol methylase